MAPATSGTADLRTVIAADDGACWVVLADVSGLLLDLAAAIEQQPAKGATALRELAMALTRHEMNVGS
jgi:hypothetical protein